MRQRLFEMSQCHVQISDLTRISGGWGGQDLVDEVDEREPPCKYALLWMPKRAFCGHGHQGHSLPYLVLYLQLRGILVADKGNHLEWQIHMKYTNIHTAIIVYFSRYIYTPKVIFKMH